ncbi:MAG: zf-HC2 domain-containing protein [Oscillospiraceae bacterium]|jgi:hypothetical protein|nr:zf-HC2 domain-containing protein [Oscillospiraceae bacterium]
MCKEYLEMISAAADGELCCGDLERLRRHMDGCASCASRFELYRLISEAVTREETAPPDALPGFVSERIAAAPRVGAGAASAPAAAASSPLRARPVWTRRAASHPARRRTNLRRLLPVACLVALLFAIRTNRMAENNRRELAAMTGGAYSRSSDYSPEIQNYSAGAGQGVGRSAPAEGRDSASADGGASVKEDAIGARDSAPEGESAPAAARDTPENMYAVPPVSEPAPEADGAAQRSPSGGDGAGYAMSSATSGYDASGFYAVVRVTGELPDMLLGKPMGELGNGEYLIRVTRAEADELIGQGCDAELTDGDLPEAAVIYKP